MAYAKAVTAAIVAAAGALGTAVADGTVTGPEWAGVVVAALTALTALGATYAVPNRTRL